MTDPAGSPPAAAAPAGGAPAAPAAAPPGGAPAAPAAPTRPEWLPEAHWDAKTNVINTETFGKHYGEVAKFYETETARIAGLPKTADDYKLEIKLPDTVKVPEGMKVELDPKDPRVPFVKDFALKNKLSSDAVNELVALDAKMKIEAHNAEIERVKAEDVKLGDNGKDRKAAVAAWAGTLGLSADELSEIRMTATTAAGVTALEKLMAKVNGSVPGTGGAPPQPPKPAEIPMADRWYSGSQQKVS